MWYSKKVDEADDNGLHNWQVLTERTTRIHPKWQEKDHEKKANVPEVELKELGVSS